MHTFHIRYRNTQGTLMRILIAASRRALDMPYVRAEPGEQDHVVTLMLEVNGKQVGQLSRDWYAIADVVHIHAGITTQTPSDLAHAGVPHRPTAAVMAVGAGGQQARA
jgi:acetolactate synthase small subunit